MCTANNNLLHCTRFEVECKAFDNNGPQLSVRGQAPTHTLSLQAHTHSEARHSHSHTRRLRREKSPTVFGRPGGDGAGHANDPSLDIWGEAGY